MGKARTLRFLLTLQLEVKLVRRSTAYVPRMGSWALVMLKAPTPCRPSFLQPNQASFLTVYGLGFCQVGAAQLRVRPGRRDPVLWWC